jgi:hypothetical protein
VWYAELFGFIWLDRLSAAAFELLVMTMSSLGVSAWDQHGRIAVTWLPQSMAKNAEEAKNRPA